MRHTLAAAAAAAAAVVAALATAVPAAAAAAGETPQGGGNNVFAGDIGNAIWTVLIFVLVLFVLGKYAWGPLLRGLQSREAFIREALESARREHAEAAARLREYEEKLAGARGEVTGIIEQGRRDAEAVKRRIEELAKQESDKMVERARREIDAATAEATRQLYAVSARLAVELASHIIGRELTRADHERLIAETIAEISARES